MSMNFAYLNSWRFFCSFQLICGKSCVYRVFGIYLPLAECKKYRSEALTCDLDHWQWIANEPSLFGRYGTFFRRYLFVIHICLQFRLSEFAMSRKGNGELSLINDAYALLLVYQTQHFVLTDTFERIRRTILNAKSIVFFLLSNKIYFDINSIQNAMWLGSWATRSWFSSRM